MDEKTPLRPGASFKEVCEYVQKFNRMPTFMPIDEYREKYIVPNMKMTSLNEFYDSGMHEAVKMAKELNELKTKERD